jgi:adenosylmethionine-8-amino-7-oxononanoate aminotransferase
MTKEPDPSIARARDLRERDLRHLWHPYSAVESLEAAPFPIIERAEGVYLHDIDGRAILDGIASWWACNLGHSHPRIVEAIRRQAATLQHSILGGMSHPRAIELAERLTTIAPSGLSRVFFASDGASAVEAALKIAVQYWSNRGVAGRHEFACLADGYHGDTLGAVGVGFVPGFHQRFAEVVHRGQAALSPHCFHCPMGKTPETCDGECFGSMERILRERRDHLAAVIVEPLCQGAAGARIYPAEYLRRLRRACDECDVLLIADEIAVGFARTGALFACELAGVAPDMMCVGKGLTGGHMPMSATLVTEAIFDAFRSAPGEDRAFYHGHTYCGNPIAAAAALAALDVYEEENIVEVCRRRAVELAAGFERLARLPTVAQSATLGMIGSLEIGEEAGGAAQAKRVARRALELGLLIRPLGAVIYLWPPLTATPTELDRMLSILAEALTSAPGASANAA